MPSFTKKEYVCHKCGFVTDVIVNFNNHSCWCHECIKCEIIFNSEDELINHVCTDKFALKPLESEKMKKNYICLKCNFICKSNGALKLHNNIHFKGQFECLYCGFATNFENLFKMHRENCDEKSAFSSTINEETEEKYITWESRAWSHEELLEIYWCDICARDLPSLKPKGNLGRRRRRILKDRGNIDQIKLDNTSDRFFYTLTSHIRSGKTIVTKRELINVVEDVRKVLKYGKMASKNDKASNESEDEINLENLKSKDCAKPEPAVQELMPTSNHSVVKKSRRKTVNYKDHNATKVIFKERSIKKEEKKTPTEKRENPNKNKQTKRMPKDRWYCNGCNKEKVADMIRCTRCRKWYHEECTGLGKEDLDEFECPDGCS